jgi:hypothetical protein
LCAFRKKLGEEMGDVTNQKKEKQRNAELRLTWVDRVRVPTLKNELAAPHDGVASVLCVGVALAAAPARAKIVHHDRTSVGWLQLEVELWKDGFSTIVLFGIEGDNDGRHVDVRGLVKIVLHIAVGVILGVHGEETPHL